MGASNWDVLPGSEGSGVIVASTGGATPPNGGGTFVLGMANRVSGSVVAHGLFTNAVNFAPIAAGKGGMVSGAIKRGTGTLVGSGVTPMLFALLQGADPLLPQSSPPAISSPGYKIGLTDSGYLALVKGTVLDGIPDVAPGTLGVLRRSTAPLDPDAWVHVRLAARCNSNGDTVLSVFRNDLTANPVTAPVWAAVPGLEQIIDDVLGANTGSLPYSGGRVGFAGRFEQTARACLFDQLITERET